MTWSDRKVLLAVLAGIAALGCAANAWIYSGHKLTYYEQPPIHSDGIGWYVYLPAVLIDHDITMRRTAEHQKAWTQDDPEYLQGVNFVATTRPEKQLPLDQYGIGEAVLMLPFFGAGHLLAMATGAPRDGFSWPYEAAAGAAGLVYVLLGLMLVASTLRRWFSRRTWAITVLGIAIGCAVIQYGTYDSVYSQGYSFFLIALVVRLSIAVWTRPTALGAAALGASIGLVGLVRLTNLPVVLFAALVGVERLADVPRRAAAILRRVDLLALGIGVFLVTLLPQLAYWYRITGHVFIDPYPRSAGFLAPLHPHFFGVLFSVRKGLFFWTPLALLAVAGLPLLRRTARPLFLPTIVYLPVATWIVASWSVWWYGGSFGMRGLIDAMPAFAIGLAALVEAARGRARRAVTVAVVVTSLLAVHGMVVYWLKAIPYDQTTFREYLDSFVHYGAKTWHLH